MVATTGINVTTGAALAAVKAVTTGENITEARVLSAVKASALNERISSAYALTAINFPTPGERSSTVEALVAAKPNLTIRNTNTVVLVAVKMGAEAKHLRAWTFTMDGHDFYVLHLGQDSTLVFDQSTQQWCQWASPEFTTWRAGMGLNWDNEIVGGDVLDGTIWTVDPTIGYDQEDLGYNFTIISYVTGFIGWRGRDPLPCYGVTLLGAQGNPVDGNAYVQLRLSDNFGHSYYDMGVVDTPIAGKYDYDISWYSLGQIDTPGRIFQIIDSGAMERIDSLELLQAPDMAQGAQGGAS